MRPSRRVDGFRRTLISMNAVGIVAAPDSPFLFGLVTGLFLGVLLGQLLRSWLAWRDWVGASREADLTERLLERFAEEQAPSDDVDRPSKAGNRADLHRPVQASLAAPRRPARTRSKGRGSAA